MARIWKEFWWLILVIIAAVVIFLVGILTDNPAHASEKPDVRELMRLARLFTNKSQGAFSIGLKNIKMNNGFYDVHISYARTRPRRLVICFIDFTIIHSFHDAARNEVRYSRPSGVLSQVPTAFIDDGADGRLDRLVTAYSPATLLFRTPMTSEESQLYYEGVLIELTFYLRRHVARA